MSIFKNIGDGLTNIVNSLSNSRSVVGQYTHMPTAKLSDSVLRSVYKSGIGSRIIDIKCGYAINDTLQFESDSDAELYQKRYAHKVKEAVRWMLVYGRAIIVLHHVGDKLSQPLGKVRPDDVVLSVFGGDEANAQAIDTDLQSERYMIPTVYQVAAESIHHSRVVDFVYRKPPAYERPNYKYGGISEFETIYEQVLSDGVIQRATPRIVEKASTMFYKVLGFRDKMAMKQDREIINYFTTLENHRGLYGAGLLDADDEVEIVSQSITGLAEIDMLGLRRLAMVTGIPLNVLVGESAKGLNSNGKQERATLQDTIESLQSEYLQEPIGRLFELCNMGDVKFKDNQGESANERAEYDKLAIENATGLAALGEDHRSYLVERGIIKEDDLHDEPDDEDLDDETETAT